MTNYLIPYPQKYEIDMEEFNKESKNVNAFNYNEFLNEKFFKDKSIIDVLYDLQTVVSYSRSKKKINKRIITDTSINLVLEFYENLGLKEKLEPIITGNNPLFNTIITKSKDSSFVGYKYLDPKITFSVGELGTIPGLCNLTHESAHAMNGHYAYFAQLVDEQNSVIQQFGENSKEFDAVKDKIGKFLYEQGKFKRDCIGEVESHIAELLFLEFLISKNTISPEDKNLYLQAKRNSFRNDLALILEENVIYKNLRRIKDKKQKKDANITSEECNELITFLKKSKYFNNFFFRLKFISERQKLGKQSYHSSYRFRYIVGTIVSSVWMNNYLKANKTERKQMLEDFKFFLLNNERLNLNYTMQILFKGQTYETVINDFVSINRHFDNNLNL